MTNDPVKLRLPGLDGLRGISILLVLMCHSNWTDHLRLASNISDKLRAVTAPLGLFGVPIFFVISGFLITYLLLQDEAHDGAISLQQFWKRRFLRIVPPVIVYVSFIIVYSAFNGVHLACLDLSAVVLFFRNLVDGNQMFDHFWSLSIEEQFYLFWPVLLVFAPRKWRFHTAVLLLVLFPLLRIASASLLTQELHVIVTRAVRFDTILVGCLLAVGWTHWRHSRLVRQCGDRIFIIGVTSVIIAWWLSYRYDVFPNFFGTRPVLRQVQQEIVTTFLNAGIACILATVVAESTRLGAFINSKCLTGIGLISYSLYLWQQVFFFAPHLPHWVCYLPVRVACAFAAGLCGYGLVERPLHKLRQKMRVNQRHEKPMESKASLDPVTAARAVE